MKTSPMFEGSSWLSLVSAAALLCACGGDKINSSTYVEPAATAAASAEAAPEKAASKTELEDADFVESERSRDPFRSFAQAFVDEARSDVVSQREVVLEQYALDELKLIGIVSGAGGDYAMLVDPGGVGWVVTRGQYIGRASVIQPAGGVGAAYEVNWRVDRIRDGDVVLVRDDPSNPEVPSATRVLPLRVDEVSVTEENSDSGNVQSELAQLRDKIQAMEIRSGGDAKSANGVAPAASAQR